MRAVLDKLDRITDASVDVLVRGASGTGKELVARALHHNGPRKTGPFVAVNCAALPETLLESELFGHVRGAFTGADRDREGLLVAANGGTLFLDELGEMPLAIQAKLLRVLQEREVRPVGATRSSKLDVRLVMETDDGHLIGMTYRGLRHGPKEVIDAIARGEEVNPASYYFRIAPFFETASDKYGWLNGIVSVGLGHRLPTGPIYQVFEVL